mmetsp:Transcript_86524/g.268882  ORF Transcript_86524/g.268882 Transcript_86524/m.268882 type:complete len:235 (+) Transcript_86524:951-1655(+)
MGIPLTARISVPWGPRPARADSMAAELGGQGVPKTTGTRGTRCWWATAISPAHQGRARMPGVTMTTRFLVCAATVSKRAPMSRRLSESRNTLQRGKLAETTSFQYRALHAASSLQWVRKTVYLSLWADHVQAAQTIGEAQTRPIPTATSANTTWRTEISSSSKLGSNMAEPSRIVMSRRLVAVSRTFARRVHHGCSWLWTETKSAVTATSNRICTCVESALVRGMTAMAKFRSM